MIRLDEGGMARHAALIPPSRLDGLVEHFWIQHWTGAPSVWRVVPDTRAHVIFNASLAKGRVQTTCRVVGARSTFADIDLDGRRLTVGARLRPGALPALLGRPASELTDGVVPIEVAFGAEGLGLLERMSTSDPPRALEALASFLSRRRAASDQALVLLDRAQRVRDVAHDVGVRPRTVHARFRQAIGLAPKLALRIERIHRALHRLNAGESIVGAATVAGFSDQPHLTRECRALLGESPTAWRRRGRAPATALRHD